MEETKSESEIDIERKTAKIKRWLKDRGNLGIVLIILISALIRLYYFAVTNNQAHWWDSLAFGSIAREQILGLWANNPFLSNEMIIRPPLLSLAWSWLIRLGLPDAASIFVMQILPSILSVVFVYLVVLRLYNKNAALISSFVFGLSWMNLFYSMRMMSDIPAMALALASMYYFVISYDKIDTKYFALSIFLVAVSILTRYLYGIIGVIFILLMVYHHKFSLLKNKKFWYGGLIGALPIIIFFILNLSKYGSILPAGSVYSSSASAKQSFAFYTLGFIPHIFSTILTIFLVIGFLVALIEFLLGFDRMKENKKIYSHLVMLLIFLLPLIFLIFILRASEDRYLLITMPAMVLFIALGIIFVYDKLKPYSKNIAIFALAALLIIGTYAQLRYGNAIIMDKKESYRPMKEAFEWIRDNTPQNATLYGDGIDPYAIYYAERQIIPNNDSDFSNIYSANYVVLHGFEYQTQQLINKVNGNPSNFVPIKAFFLDASNKQPIVVIYKVVPPIETDLLLKLINEKISEHNNQTANVSVNNSINK